MACSCSSVDDVSEERIVSRLLDIEYIPNLCLKKLMREDGPSLLKLLERIVDYFDLKNIRKWLLVVDTAGKHFGGLMI